MMHAKYQCSITNTSEDMSQVKVFVTDGQTEGRTDRRMRFKVPRFHKRRGTINVYTIPQTKSDLRWKGEGGVRIWK